MSKQAIFQGSISASLVTSGFVNAHRRFLVSSFINNGDHLYVATVAAFLYSMASPYVSY